MIRAEIRLMIEWKEDLKDKESTGFRQVADSLAKEVGKDMAHDRFSTLRH